MAASPLVVVGAKEEAAAIEKRIADSAQYLASDELEGRGLTTKGIDLAAQYIATQFAESGLKTELFEGTPLQKFTLTMSAEIGPDNRLTLIGPPGDNGSGPDAIELKLGENFSPMAASGSGEFDLPLVFVGYGITGKQEGYDDYAGMDVTGKAVIIFRHEPQQADPHSVFDGTKVSPHAPFGRKISNAYEHGAACVIFCTDQFDIQKTVAAHHKKWQQALDQLNDEHAKFKEIENLTFEQIESQRKRVAELIHQVEVLSERLSAAYDPVLPFHAAGRGESGRDFPIVHCRRATLDRIVTAALGTDLATLEEQIDAGPTPQSRELTPWRITGQIDVNRKQTEVKNVVGMLEGEGPLAEETIVIGGHYDHVGWGPHAKQKTVHNGADDNASGVSVLIEIARTLAKRPEKLCRKVVFIAFTAEERGLLGSSHYVGHPLIPLEKTVAMLNLDMVGRLREDKLIVVGCNTATSFAPLLDRINQQHGLNLVKKNGGVGPSDHAPFHAKQVPALHFFTGMHENYHRPTDDFDTLNVPGMRRVSGFVNEVVVELANAADRPEHVAAKAPPSRQGGTRPYFGSIPDFGSEEPGYTLSGVTKDSPAEKAGLQTGDAIIQFGESKIGNLEDFDSALRKCKGGDRVPVVVRRGKESKTFEVTLDPPR